MFGGMFQGLSEYNISGYIQINIIIALVNIITSHLCCHCHRRCRVQSSVVRWFSGSAVQWFGGSVVRMFTRLEFVVVFRCVAYYGPCY